MSSSSPHILWIRYQWLVFMVQLSNGKKKLNRKSFTRAWKIIWTSPYIVPPLLLLSRYGCKSSVKCFIVVLLLSLLWTSGHKSSPSPQACETKKAARHDNKRESHLWNVLIMWVVQRKTICLITSNWSGLTVKASACRPVNCTVSWCLGRREE